MGTGPNTYPVSRYIYKEEDQCNLTLQSFSMYPIRSVENSDDLYTFASHPEFKHTDSGYMQVFASEANIGDGPELGHIGSARNLAKLNVVSPAVFPLPAAMTAPSGEDIYIPEDPEEPDSVAGAKNGVEEFAVALDTDTLLQIRVQGTINAGRFFAVSIICVTGTLDTLDRQMCPLQCCKWH